MNSNDIIEILIESRNEFEYELYRIVNNINNIKFYHHLNKTINNNNIPSTLTNNKHFNFTKYFSYLSTLCLGNTLLYAYTLPSTSELLNTHFIYTNLPILLYTTYQYKGKGRGDTQWIANSSALCFSVALSVPLQSVYNPIFIQYITSISVVHSINILYKSRSKYRVRIKWPNDIVLILPNDKVTKLGGILISTTNTNDILRVTIGIGINLDNTFPTGYCINSFIDSDKICAELLLATIMNNIERDMSRFYTEGFTNSLYNRYLYNWIHSNQTVSDNNNKYSIVGISTKGYLLAKINNNIQELDPNKHYDFYYNNAKMY